MPSPLPKEPRPLISPEGSKERKKTSPGVKLGSGPRLWAGKWDLRSNGSEKLGWRTMAPCITSPHPETDRLEAKQLLLCLLSKRVEVPKQKSKVKERPLIGSQKSQGLLFSEARKPCAEAAIGSLLLVYRIFLPVRLKALQV